jgi:sterol desaturase/sphingolipid hydroxylase (fatty acid hydroxylase superfamily)
MLASIAHRLIPAGFLHTMAGLPAWLRIAIAFVAGEVGYYWGHRLSHEIPLLWRFHSIHHSAEAMDFLVNTRAHPLDVVWGRFCMLIPIYLLGLAGPTVRNGLTVPIAVILIGTFWSFFVHANLRWRFGPLEWVVATPHFHHWHHTKSGPIDRNYASNLPLIDWIFGSLLLPRDWPADYGIKTSMPPALSDQLLHPFMPAVKGPPAPNEAAKSSAPLQPQSNEKIPQQG